MRILYSYVTAGAYAATLIVKNQSYMELFTEWLYPYVTFALPSTEGVPAAGAALSGEGVHEPQYDPICASQHPPHSSASQRQGVHRPHPAHAEASLQDTGARPGRPIIFSWGDS